MDLKRAHLDYSRLFIWIKRFFKNILFRNEHEDKLFLSLRVYFISLARVIDSLDSTIITLLSEIYNITQALEI